MNSLISQFMSVWLHPWSAMESVKAEGADAGLKSSMIFVVAMGVVSGLITAIMGTLIPSAMVPGTSKAMLWSSVLLVPLVSFIGSFIGAFIIWGLVDGLLTGTAEQYKTSYRLLALLAAFSPVSALLSPIPGTLFLGITVGQLLSIGVNLWATIVMVRGIIIVRDTPVVRTVVTCVLLFGFLFILGIFARVAAQRQLQTGGFNDFGAADFGAPTDDLATDSDNLEEQLQGLADKAKADKPK